MSPVRRYTKGPVWLYRKGSGGAKYKCLECQHEFVGDLGANVCPECESPYVEWVNFDEWRARHPLPPLVAVLEALPKERSPRDARQRNQQKRRRRRKK